MTTSKHSSELQQLAEHVYQESGFDGFTCDGFDADDRGDIIAALMAEIDYLMRESWRLAGGDLEQFRYPTHPTMIPS